MDSESHAPVSLVVIEGRDLGLVFVLDRGAKKTIGRSKESDICLQGDGVSRHHARIECNAVGQVFVQDLGSANGTYINEVSIRNGLLNPGDRLRLGVEVVLHYESERRDERDTADLPASDFSSPAETTQNTVTLRQRAVTRILP